jgi:hypothetical protein
MVDQMPTPEFLLPKSKELSSPRSFHQMPTGVKITLGISGAVLLAILLAAIGLFYQVRGVQDLLTSRICLGAAWVCGFLLISGYARLSGSARWRPIAFVAGCLLFIAIIVMDHVYPTPKAALPSVMKVTSYEILPYVSGKPPQLHMHVQNSSDATMQVTMQSDPYTVTNPPTDYKERKLLEDKLWKRFEAGLDLITTNRPILDVPSNQDSWFLLTGLDNLPHNIIAGTGQNSVQRFYFLSRASDSKGRTLFDSCVYIEPPSPLVVLYCVNHN